MHIDYTEWMIFNIFMIIYNDISSFNIIIINIINHNIISIYICYKLNIFKCN